MTWKTMRSGSLAAMLLILAAASALSAIKPTCSECGMIVDQDSKFSARVEQGGMTLFFCDIGDLLVYLNKKNTSGAGTHVKDHPSGDWIDAQTALYVQSPKRFRTPMSWGIAAFRDKKRAEEYGTPLDFDAILKKVK